MSFIREQVVKRTTRSSGWSRTRKNHIKSNPTCYACGRKNGLEVHHIQDFSSIPELELEPSNLITLCDKGTKCHFSFGHLGNWKSINPEVKKDSTWFLNKVKGRR